MAEVLLIKHHRKAGYSGTAKVIFYKPDDFIPVQFTQAISRYHLLVLRAMRLDIEAGLDQPVEASVDGEIILPRFARLKPHFLGFRLDTLEDRYQPMDFGLGNTNGKIIPAQPWRRLPAIRNDYWNAASLHSLEAAPGRWAQSSWTNDKLRPLQHVNVLAVVVRLAGRLVGQECLRMSEVKNWTPHAFAVT